MIRAMHEFSDGFIVTEMKEELMFEFLYERLIPVLSILKCT